MCCEYLAAHWLQDKYSLLENEILKSMEVEMYQEMLAKSRICVFLCQPYSIFEVEE